MYQTLDELETILTHPKKRFTKFSKFFGELKILWLIFTVLFLGSYLVTNAQLVIDNVSDVFSSNTTHRISNESTSFTSDQTLSQEKSDEVEALIEMYGDNVSLQQEVATSMDHFLQQNLDSYEFSFNLLPPTNRIVIPSINLDVPLVESRIQNSKDFSETAFDADLENGVVKYPTTPNPWEWGNSFFFGHTSQEYRKKNPYGTVFRNIPQLKPGEIIQIVREWVLYEYKVVDTVIVRPKDVNDSYMKFWSADKEYITLMWCYPIWRADKRMMVFAERI